MLCTPGLVAEAGQHRRAHGSTRWALTRRPAPVACPNEARATRHGVYCTDLVSRKPRFPAPPTATQRRGRGGGPRGRRGRGGRPAQSSDPWGSSCGRSTPGGHLGAEDNQPVELVQEGALPAAALRVRLLHDQLRVHLTGQTEGLQARRRARPAWRRSGAGGGARARVGRSRHGSFSTRSRDARGSPPPALRAWPPSNPHRTQGSPR